MKFFRSEQYQPRCLQLYKQYTLEIKRLLPDARVEHIGASSVPGALSKGDLDIFVGVDSEYLEVSVRTLQKLGFQEKRDTLRTPELCMLESQLVDDVALQVVANGSESECYIEFRDKLIATPRLVERYNDLKRGCEGMEHDEYRDKKAIFITQVLGDDSRYIK